jgi:SAM-dependent methyltransferase
MHDSVMTWVAEMVERHRLADKRVLEVGSMDVNGSVRPLFYGVYMGIDKEPGPGVDYVQDIEEHIYPPDFEVIVCTEMLEHTLRPWRALRHMAYSLQPGGVLLLTCRGFDAERGAFPFHQLEDHWRMSQAALVRMISDAGFAQGHVTADPAAPGWFCYATR